MHINRIKYKDNIKNIHNELFNKVHIENNSANSITKKTHIKVFNDIPKKVKSINNTHIDYDRHNVLKQIKQVKIKLIIHLLTLISVKKHIKNYLLMYLIN